MGRLIITIDEIIAGRGLISNRETTPPSIEVYCGNGMEYGDNDDLQVNAGPGLGFAPGPCVCDPINPNVPTSGPALMVLNTEIAGNGLVPSDGVSVAVDTSPDPIMQQSYTAVTDAKFQMDGYNLVFATTYTQFIVQRNTAGIVLGVVQGESSTELQPLNIDGYGYSSTPASVPQKRNDNNLPSFYKQQ